MLLISIGMVSIEAGQQEYTLQTAFHTIIEVLNARASSPHDADLLKTQFDCERVIEKKLAKARDLIVIMDPEEDRPHFIRELDILCNWKRQYTDKNSDVLNQHSCHPSQEGCRVQGYRKILDGVHGRMVIRAHFIDKLVEVIEERRARAQEQLLKKRITVDIERVPMSVLLRWTMETLEKPVKDLFLWRDMYQFETFTDKRMAEARRVVINDEIENVQDLAQALDGLQVLRENYIDKPMDTMECFSEYTVPEKIKLRILTKAKNIEALMTFKWRPKNISEQRK